MHLSTFDPPADELSELLAEVGGLVTEMVAGMAGDDVLGHPRGDAVVAAVQDAVPDAPVELSDALATLRAVLATGDRNTAPGELGYIPGSGMVASALGDLIAQVANRYTGLAGFAPAAVALEAGVLRWLTDCFGFPDHAQAVLTSGGSIANLSALVAARDRHAPDAAHLATVYVGTHAHASVRKAARIAGIRGDHVRVCGASDGLRLDPEAVRIAVKQDLADGLQPIAIVGAAGTTNAGAIDPLPELADVAADAGVWFHVDAAYGGFFQLTDRGRARLAGIERADSITLDPHKSLFLPFGTGALIVRDRDDLLRSFSEDADYLRDHDAAVGDSGRDHSGPHSATEGAHASGPHSATDGLPDLGSLTPELTRSWRGLRLWLPLQLHGVDAFRTALDRALDLADRAWRAFDDDPNVEVVGSPDLSIVTFRGPGGDAAQDALLAAVNADGRVRLSSTVIDGQVVLRLAVLSHRTTVAEVDVAVARVRDAAALS